MPRRMLRLLAKAGNKAMIATLLGHFLRCLYYRNRTCRPTGTCKASWIAETFGVDVRNVKAARRALAEAGLLKAEPRSQGFLNRYGPLVTVNLAWESGPVECGRVPPPGAKNCRVLPPRYKEPELLRKMKNQKPPPAVAGVDTAPRALAAPSLRHVVAADLVDGRRLSALHEQAWLGGYHRGIYPAITPGMVASFTGRAVRFGAYGDPAAVPYDVWRPILAVAGRWTGYTHQWRTCDPQCRGFLMASCDGLADYQEARARGWRTFRIRTAEAPLLAGEFICPAADEAGKRTTCERCCACNGTRLETRLAAGNPVIIVHGAKAGRLQMAG